MRFMHYILLQSPCLKLKSAYRYIAQVYELEKELEKALKDKDAGILEALELATEKMDKSIERYELAARGYHQLHNALRSVHSDTVIDLMSPDAAQALLTLSAHLLAQANHPDCHSAARYISNRLNGLTLATADFYQKQLSLCATYPQEIVALACYYFEYHRSIKLKKIYKTHLSKVQRDMLAAYHYIYKELNEVSADKLMTTVAKLLTKRHRASSAIEGLNALLRPYLYVRKGVSQGFLELFKAWHNLRTRRSGKHKDTSAYQLLTGKPVNDWLTVLGFPPSNTAH